MPVPDMTDLTAEEAKSILKEMNITALFRGNASTVTAQIPMVGQSMAGDSQMILYFGEQPEQETVSVPDFIGMNRQQAADTATNAGLYILVKGNPSLETNVVVTAQSIGKDTQVSPGTMIELEFTDTKATD